jgi:hypothetical protein
MTGGEISEESAVEAYLEGRIDFESLAESVGQRRAEAVRASAELLDRGDELADELADR